MSPQIQYLNIVRDSVLQLVHLTNFCVVNYVSWWITSPVASEAPINDFNFIQQLFVDGLCQSCHTLRLLYTKTMNTNLHHNSGEANKSASNPSFITQNNQQDYNQLICANKALDYIHETKSRFVDTLSRFKEISTANSTLNFQQPGIERLKRIENSLATNLECFKKLHELYEICSQTRNQLKTELQSGNKVLEIPISNAELKDQNKPMSLHEQDLTRKKEEMERILKLKRGELKKLGEDMQDLNNLVLTSFNWQNKEER